MQIEYPVVPCIQVHPWRSSKSLSASDSPSQGRVTGFFLWVHPGKQLPCCSSFEARWLKRCAASGCQKGIQSIWKRIELKQWHQTSCSTLQHIQLEFTRKLTVLNNCVAVATIRLLNDSRRPSSISCKTGKEQLKDLKEYQYFLFLWPCHQIFACQVANLFTDCTRFYTNPYSSFIGLLVELPLMEKSIVAGGRVLHIDWHSNLRTNTVVGNIWKP